VAGLRNVDEELAHDIADGLGLSELPERIGPAREPRTDLAPSPALSILANAPATFAGRKIAVLGTDGFYPAVLAGLQTAAQADSVTVEVIAPKVGGATAGDGSLIRADQTLD